MANMTEKTKPGWAVPVQIKENFVDFCADVGSVTQEDFTGALFLWTKMPSQIREYAKLSAKNASNAVKKDFWQKLYKEIEKAVSRIIFGVYLNTENGKIPPQIEALLFRLLQQQELSSPELQETKNRTKRPQSS